MKFDLLDSNQREVEHQRHLLSMRDMCQLEHLQELAESGACSFKIEGRLKDVEYVKNVVSAYSKELNKIVNSHPDLYSHASYGRVDYGNIHVVTLTFIALIFAIKRVRRIF